MTASIELRLRVEAAFPGSTISPDPEFGTWQITFPMKLDLDGAEVSGVNCWDDGSVVSIQLVLTAATIDSAKSRWLAAREAVYRRLDSVTVHQLIEARRRLGL